MGSLLQKWRHFLPPPQKPKTAAALAKPMQCEDAAKRAEWQQKQKTVIEFNRNTNIILRSPRLL